jgi:hypothetical protein
MDRTRIDVALDHFGFAGVPLTVPGYAEAHELVPQIDEGTSSRRRRSRSCARGG